MNYRSPDMLGTWRTFDVDEYHLTFLECHSVVSIRATSSFVNSSLSSAKSVCGRAAIPKISTIIITIIDRFIIWFDGYIKLNKDMGKIIIVIQRNTEVSE
jgi:hypothetical protein